MTLDVSSDLLVKSQSLLKQKLAEAEILVDDSRLLQTSLSPYFISNEKFQILSKQCELIVSSMEKFLRLYMESLEIQNLFPELEKFRDLTLIQPKFKKWINMARFDFIESPTGDFQLLETICTCPAFFVTSAFKKIYAEELELLPKFLGNLELVPLPMDNLNFFTTNLVKLSQEVLKKDKPNIAILTSTFKPVGTDVNLLEKATRNLGYNCKRSSVQDLEFKNGVIYAGNMPIDVVYQKMLFFIDESANQMIPCIYKNSEYEVEAYMKGIREQIFVCANSFVSYLVAENKRIVALLRRPEFNQHFIVEENAAIKELLPETYSFDVTNQQDFDKYLPEFLKNRSEYVIKSAGDTRGMAVWIGQDCSDEKWNSLVLKARDEPFIIQKYIPQNLTPVYDASDCPKLVDMYSTVSVHIVQGKVCGLICRSSAAKISNESQAGLVRPAFVVQ